MRGEAGREMDAAIAEKVMGTPVEWRTVRSVRGDRVEPRGPLPAYSTDVAAAVSALDALGGIAKITRMQPYEWHVVIGDVGRWGETLPLAICRAALAACGDG